MVCYATNNLLLSITWKLLVREKKETIESNILAEAPVSTVTACQMLFIKTMLQCHN